METIERKKMNFSNSLGSLTKLSEHEHGVIGQTDNGAFKVTVYSPEIIRIQVSQGDEFGWNMCNSDCRIGFVNMLSTSATCTISIDP